MSKARIILKGEDPKELDLVINQIKELAKVLNMKIKGPVNLPRKVLEISTRRTPCGDGSDTYEHWQKRICRRLVDIEGDEKYIKQILRVKVPPDVFVKISLSS